MRHFRFDHLPAQPASISEKVAKLARDMNAALPPSAEKTAGLRKLLEAKDCFVRARLEAMENEQLEKAKQSIERFVKSME